MEVRCECGTPLDHNAYDHPKWCSVGADPIKVSESTKRDPERWIESYVFRNTQSVRLAVLAQSNGRH